MFGIIICIHFIIGFIVVYVSAVIHLIQAELRGYKALEFWSEHGSIISENVTFMNFLFGLVIWPIRAADFWARAVPMYYGLYDSNF